MLDSALCISLPHPFLTTNKLQHSGTLGIGSSTDKGVPTLINSLNNKGITAIFAANQSNAFIDSEGEVYTCGNSLNGRLGHGDEAMPETTPRVVEDLKGKRVSAGKSAAVYHFCSFITPLHY